METVIALVLFLSILTGCAGESLTNVKSSSITPNAAQTEEAAVRYTVETETCADTIQAEDGTELLVYQFEVPELEVCRADGEIVNEAETDQEEQALTAAETFTPALLAADSDEFLKAVEQELNVQALQIAADADLPPEEYFWADYTDILRDWVNYAVSFDETGMTVAFSPYELACYAAGEQVFHLPYDQILPYLSEHGKRVLGISQED